jgi:hypothetical protein
MGVPGAHADGLLVSIASTPILARKPDRETEAFEMSLLVGTPRNVWSRHTSVRPGTLACSDAFFAIPPSRKVAMKTAALALTLLATPAFAQATPAEAPPPAPPAVVQALDAKPSLYQIQVQPRVWYVGLSGDLTLPGTPVNTAATTLNELNLDSPQAAPFGNATIRFGNWTVNLSAASTSSDRSTTAQANGQIGTFTFLAGDPIRSSFDFTTAEASVGYSLGTWSRTPRPDGSFGVVADLALIAGARLYDIKAGVGATSPTTSEADEFFFEPIVGGRLELNLAKDFSIDVQSTFGYLPADREAASWDIEVAFAWRIVENLGLQVGYRNMFIHLESGSDASRFEWEGGVAGVFAGLQLRF